VTVRIGGARGWVLLEMLVALAVFTMTALAVLGAMDRGLRSAERTRDSARAVDLARTTMAKLEAGLGTVQSLSGPVPAWSPGLAGGAGFEDEAPAGFEESLPAESLWEVQIETRRSEFPGLTVVLVTAIKRAAPSSERVRASYTLGQLVRLGADEADTVGEFDDLGLTGPGGGR
jgi:hypothetical protein